MSIRAILENNLLVLVLKLLVATEGFNKLLSMEGTVLYLISDWAATKSLFMYVQAILTGTANR